MYAMRNWLESSNFGKAVISLENGSKVYVIRESWGLHSDEISVTQNPDGCLPPNPARDYIDTYGDGHSLIYSVSGNELTIYDEAGPTRIHEPDSPWTGVQVTVKALRDPSWTMMHQNPQQFGVIVVDVPLNEVCWKNFLRTAGTSLRMGR
jgi:hypothetical protein